MELLNVFPADDSALILRFPDGFYYLLPYRFTDELPSRNALPYPVTGIELPADVPLLVQKLADSISGRAYYQTPSE